MAFWMTSFLLLVCMIRILEDLQTIEYETIAPNPFEMEENPQIFFAEMIFITLWGICFFILGYFFTYWFFPRNESIGDIGRYENSSQTPLVSFTSNDYHCGEESDLEEYFTKNQGHNFTGLAGKTSEVNQLRRHTRHFIKQRKMSRRTVLVPCRPKIKMLVILRRRYLLKKKVPTCHVTRSVSLTDILLAGNCVEFSDLYISVFNFQEQTLPPVTKSGQGDFAISSNIVHSTTQMEPSDRELLNISRKGGNKGKSDLNA